MQIGVFYNKRVGLLSVRIGDDIFYMSSDANMPNGYCQYAGRFADFHPADFVVPISEIPIGVTRAIVRIAVGNALTGVKDAVEKGLAEM